MNRRFIIVSVISCWAILAAADPGLFPDRRRPQFQNIPGHVVVPYAYDLPGIGSGFGLLGALSNVAGSYTDIAGTGFFGDVNGQALSVDQVHLIPQKLFFDVGGVRLSAVTMQNFSQRGMRSDKNDYSLVEFGDSLFGGSRLTATFMQRRYEFYFGYYGGMSTLKALRDKNGEVLIKSEDAPKGHFNTIIYGTRLDFTDDIQDPRRGARFETGLWHTPRRKNGPDYYTMDYTASAFVPVGKRNTWAFNYFRSDAHVLHKGPTDPAVVEKDLGLDLSTITDPEELRESRMYIDNIVAENSHGSATSLGGYSRLRSYAGGRFVGAHSEFFGTEFRWNVTDQVKPFDIYFMKDIRTALQIAFFYEAGSVVDKQSELWHISRSSYGLGFRLVTVSGIVYRVDIATGKEGTQPSIFFQYPWEVL